MNEQGTPQVRSIPEVCGMDDTDHAPFNSPRGDTSTGEPSTAQIRLAIAEHRSSGDIWFRVKSPAFVSREPVEHLTQIFHRGSQTLHLDPETVFRWAHCVRRYAVEVCVTAPGRRVSTKRRSKMTSGIAAPPPARFWPALMLRQAKVGSARSLPRAAMKASAWR